MATRRSVLGGLLATPTVARAQTAGGEWPNRTVRFIGIFPPGGGTDILSRIWCAKLSELTGQQFVVENRSGSAGNVGTEAIARATPDGYTLGLASVAPLAIGPTLYGRLPFDPAKDFSWIGGMYQLPNLLVVNNDLPVRSVPELVALLRANPGRYTFASSGSGTTVHLSGEMLKVMAGVDILHVPYRGGAPAHVDLLAGRVNMIFDNIPQALAEARDGKVRALAVTSAERSPLVPEFPAMAETLPGFDITSWAGICGPAGLAPAMLRRAAELNRRAIADASLRKLFMDNGATPWWTDGEDFACFRAEQEKRFAPLIRASGARVD